MVDSPWEKAAGAFVDSIKIFQWVKAAAEGGRKQRWVKLTEEEKTTL